MVISRTMYGSLLPLRSRLRSYRRLGLGGGEQAVDFVQQAIALEDILRERAVPVAVEDDPVGIDEIDLRQLEFHRPDIGIRGLAGVEHDRVCDVMAGHELPDRSRI